MSLTVRAISEDGFPWLSSSHRGDDLGILPEALNLPAEVSTSNGPVAGVFARSTGHLRGHADTDPSWDGVHLDLGLPDRAAVLAAGVHVGCPVLYRAETRRVGRRKIRDVQADLAREAIRPRPGRSAPRATRHSTPGYRTLRPDEAPTSRVTHGIHIHRLDPEEEINAEPQKAA